MAVQVWTTMISVMYKNKLKTRKKILRRLLMMPCWVFLRSHLRNARRIAILDSGRSRVGGLGNSLLQLR